MLTEQLAIGMMQEEEQMLLLGMQQKVCVAPKRLHAKPERLESVPKMRKELMLHAELKLLLLTQEETEDKFCFNGIKKPR